MTRSRENADGARLDAPLASPAFSGTPTGITAAHIEAGVLPSDVTGGSGLTALGTVVSGNLSHASIVYPPGHILQVVSNTFKNQASQTNVSANVDGTSGGYSVAGLDWTDLDTEIQPTYSNSTILIMVNASFSTSTNVYGTFRIKRGIDGATPSISASNSWTAEGNMATDALGGSMFGSTNGGGAPQGWGMGGLPPFAFIAEDSPNTTTVVKYRINTYLKSDISGAGLLWLNRTFYSNNDYGQNRGASTVTLMEIAR